MAHESLDSERAHFGSERGMTQSSESGDLHVVFGASGGAGGAIVRELALARQARARGYPQR